MPAFTCIIQPTALFLLLCWTSAALATEPPITAVAFAPDGKSVVVCSQAGLSAWSYPELVHTRKIATSAATLHALAFSPQGDRLAVAGGAPAEEGCVEILSWPASDSLQVLRGHRDTVMAVVWRDESTLVSASLDHTLRVWNTESGKALRILEGHSRGVLAMGRLPAEDLLVSAGIDQNLRVWRIDSGELEQNLPMHIMPVSSLAVCPKSEGLPLIASASDDKTVRIWQPTIGRMVRFARLPAPPLALEWLPDGSALVASCTDGRAYRIDPLTVEITQQDAVLNGWAYALAVHPTDNCLLVGGSNGELRRIGLDPTK